MPNWCQTTYACVGEKKDVQALYNAILACQRAEEPIVNNGFGNLWLGCVIEYFGKKWTDYGHCRGEIFDYQIQDDVLFIYQETAWCEQEDFRKFIEDTFKSIKVYYMEEEPGCEVYCTNDREGLFFSDRYFLDAYEDPQYFETIEEAAKFVSDLVGQEVSADVNAIESALDEYVEVRQENDEDVYYCFHGFRVMND